MDKIPKQKYVEIWSIPIHNYDPINDQLENTGKILFALQPTSPLHSCVYPVSDPNSSTPFNLLVQFKRNRLWVMNVVNFGK